VKFYVLLTGLVLAALAGCAITPPSGIEPLSAAA
jgi:hypothetical protein